MIGSNAPSDLPRRWLDDDGIFHIAYATPVTVDIEVSRADVAFVDDRRGDRKARVVVDMSLVHTVTREARSYYASDEVASKFAAVALVVDSPVSRIIGNFFLGLNKPAYPLRLFNDEAAAVEWLSSVGRADG